MDKTWHFSKGRILSLQELKYSYRHHTARKYVLKLLSLSGIILLILFYFWRIQHTIQVFCTSNTTFQAKSWESSYSAKWVTETLYPLFPRSRTLTFLDAFQKSRKAISFVPSVRLSAGNNSSPTWRIFMKFYIEVFFRKTDEKIQVSLKLDKTKESFTWKLIYVFHISLSYS